MIRRFLLLPLFLLSLSVFSAYAAVPKNADLLEQIIQANEGDSQDPLGLTLRGTLKATVFNTAYYTVKCYLRYYVWAPISEPRVLAASKRLMQHYVSEDYLENDDDVYDEIERDGRVLEAARNKMKERLNPTKKENLDVAKLLAAQAATANLTYAAVRAATKELTGYDAALLVKDSMQAVAAQAITHHLIPRVPLMNNKQIASYVAADLTVAATMYAYKEMTGNKLRCPQLPIPTVLRDMGLDEEWIGDLVYSSAKYALRTQVMDPMCGATAPYISGRSF